MLTAIIISINLASKSQQPYWLLAPAYVVKCIRMTYAKCHWLVSEVCLVRNCFECNTHLRTKNKHFLKQNFSASITLIQGHFGYMALPPGPRVPKFPFDIGLREFTNEDLSSKQPPPPEQFLNKPLYELKNFSATITHIETHEVQPQHLIKS